jgi:hypothetical protein
MTKASARNLHKGREVFNKETGEIAFFNSAIGTVADTIYIESVDRNGRSHIWSYKQT